MTSINLTRQITADVPNLSINRQGPQTNDSTVSATAAVAGVLHIDQQEEESNVLHIDADRAYSSPPQTPRRELECPPAPKKPTQFAKRKSAE